MTAGRTKVFLSGVVALLVGGGGGYVGATMFGGGGGGQDMVAEIDEDGDTERYAPRAPRARPAVVPLNDFVVNLRGSGGGRVLRLERLPVFA